METMRTMADRFCRGCGRWLSLNEFSFKSLSAGVRHSRCRACSRAVSRRHYERHKEDYLERSRRANPVVRRAIGMRILQYLRERQCARCGEADPVVLEFNHLDPALKVANVGEIAAKGFAWGRVEEELAKCEVLCANCHQRHTTIARHSHYKVAEASRGPAWRVAANRRNAALVLNLLRTAACLDCGIADPLVLQFDHRPGEIKDKDIGWYVSSGSRASLLSDELAKCDVRCANCHRRRTAIERGWLRAQGST
jgi:hypothetical protein